VFVDLSSVREHRLVAATIAHGLNVQEPHGHSARELLLDRLGQIRMLLSKTTCSTPSISIRPFSSTRSPPRPAASGCTEVPLP